MNRKRYTSDPRYSAVLDNMDLLGITDVSTERQDKNGTIQWRLPIKNIWPGNRKNATCIEVASFESGYVRRQNGCYTPYQLNKRPATERYYKDYKTTWNDNNTDYTQEWTGKYNKYTSKITTKIPIEIDRLEYLISYCLKNYYIKHANFVANGDYVPKWTHEWELERLRDKHSDEMDARQLKYLNLADAARLDYKDKSFADKYKTDKLIELRKEIRDLETQVSMYKGDVVVEWKYTDALTRIRDLENKLDTIQRIADYE